MRHSITEDYSRLSESSSFDNNRSRLLEKKAIVLIHLTQFSNFKFIKGNLNTNSETLVELNIQFSYFRFN